MSLIILIQIYKFDRGIIYDYYKPRFESWCKWLLTIGLLDLEGTNELANSHYLGAMGVTP